MVKEKGFLTEERECSLWSLDQQNVFWGGCSDDRTNEGERSAAKEGVHGGEKSRIQPCMKQMETAEGIFLFQFVAKFFPSLCGLGFSTKKEAVVKDSGSDGTMAALHGWGKRSLAAGMGEGR